MIKKTLKVLLLLTIAANIIVATQAAIHLKIDPVTDKELNSEVTGPVHFQGNDTKRWSRDVESEAPKKTHSQAVHPNGHKHTEKLINKSLSTDSNKIIKELTHQKSGNHASANQKGMKPPKAPKFSRTRVHTYDIHNHYERKNHKQKLSQDRDDSRHSDPRQKSHLHKVKMIHTEPKADSTGHPSRESVKRQMAHMKLIKKKFVENSENCHQVETICVRKCKVEHFAERTFHASQKKFTYKLLVNKKMTTGNFAQFRTNSKQNIVCQKKCYEKNSCWSIEKQKNKKIYKLCAQLNLFCRRDFCPRHANMSHLPCVLKCSGSLCTKLTKQAILIRNKFFMLRKNFEDIKTGRGLIKTVNRNIPDSLRNIPLHKNQCRKLVAFGAEVDSMRRKTQKLTHLVKAQKQVSHSVQKTEASGKKWEQRERKTVRKEAALREGHNSMLRSFAEDFPQDFDLSEN